jgi:hypothetical protein
MAVTAMLAAGPSSKAQTRLAGDASIVVTKNRGPQYACGQCHLRETAEFRRTAMANAARSPEFLAEWETAEHSPRCLACHAPSGTGGITCVACHGAGPHPYPAVAVPGACASCHDAPGERTVERFLASPAARRGEDCLDCHLPRRPGEFRHDLRGPTTPGYLTDTASLRAALRGQGHDLVAVVQVRHRAGHALPGGTTGRAVWLQLDGLDDSGRSVWRERVRFGWEHGPGGRWRDRTLPPGRSAILEVRNAGRQETRRVRAVLLYRFRPGPLDQPDPRQVVLDALDIPLPPTAGSSGRETNK